MNNKTTIMYLILIMAPFFFGCRQAVKVETKNAPSASTSSQGQKYNIDPNQSLVEWKGAMSFVPNSHTGYVYVSKGELMMAGGQLVAGTAEINMNSIVDDKHRADNNLIDHLKDPDFFDVKKFPFSTIAITGVEPTNNAHKKIIGNLTIKGITQPVSFPAKVDFSNGVVKADGRLVIDRTKWDIRYKSGKFYDLLADQTMSDSIEFNIKIVARM